MQINNTYYQQQLQLSKTESQKLTATEKIVSKPADADSSKSGKVDTFERTLVFETTTTTSITAELAQSGKGQLESGKSLALAGWGNIDDDKLSAIKADVQKYVSDFQQFIQSLFNHQGKVASSPLDSLLSIFNDNLKYAGAASEDYESSFYYEETSSSTTTITIQEAISEDGYWGVEQTANRIVDFAKGVSGGDTSKIALLRDAILSAFSSSEKAWGSKLPDISYQTIDRVKALLDDWEKPATDDDTAEVAAEAGAIFDD
jgi:hypothetical protein